MLGHAPTVSPAGTEANFAPGSRAASEPPCFKCHGQQAGTDGAMPYGRGMANAARILAALKRDGWTESRPSGSHRVLVKGDQQRVWAYHDGVDLGSPALARIARDYGYTIDELRKL
jgi:predicted RNA binding protein YcfA (HicA-like mRNA interferase family)